MDELILPKILIDYSKVCTGEKPFDKKYYFLFWDSDEAKKNRQESIEAGFSPPPPCSIGKWDSWKNVWDFGWTDTSDYEGQTQEVTHYSPLPMFEEKQ